MNLLAAQCTLCAQPMVDGWCTHCDVPCDFYRCSVCHPIERAFVFLTTLIAAMP